MCKNERIRVGNSWNPGKPQLQLFWCVTSETGLEKSVSSNAQGKPVDQEIRSEGAQWGGKGFRGSRQVSCLDLTDGWVGGRTPFPESTHRVPGMVLRLEQGEEECVFVSVDKRSLCCQVVTIYRGGAWWPDDMTLLPPRRVSPFSSQNHLAEERQVWNLKCAWCQRGPVCSEETVWESE